MTYDGETEEVWFQTSLAQRKGTFGTTVGGDQVWQSNAYSPARILCPKRVLEVRPGRNFIPKEGRVMCGRWATRESFETVESFLVLLFYKFPLNELSNRTPAAK